MSTGRPPRTVGARRHPAGGGASEPVVFQELADRVGDLLVAVLAEDEAVMGVRAERLVPGAQPLGEPVDLRLGDIAVEPAPTTRIGTSARCRRSTVTPWRIWRRAAPASRGSCPRRCLILTMSLSVRSRCSRWRRSGRVSHPSIACP